jgi:hypothetical protein
MHNTTRSTPARPLAAPAAPAAELTPVPWSNRWRCAELGLDGGVDPFNPALWGPEGPFGEMMAGLVSPTAEAIARTGEPLTPGGVAAAQAGSPTAAPEVAMQATEPLNPGALALQSTAAVPQVSDSATRAQEELTPGAVGAAQASDPTSGPEVAQHEASPWVPGAQAAEAGAVDPGAATCHQPSASLTAFAARAAGVMSAGAAGLSAAEAGASASGLAPGDQARLGALLAKDSLSVDEVAEARALAEQLPAAERQEAHRAIAARSPYATQRDNAHALEADDGGTCFATSVAMALMSLGVPNPDPTVEYEVALLGLAKGDIEHSQTWIEVAKGLGRSGALVEGRTINGWTLDQWRDNITAIIGGGQAAVLSIGGHVVRVEGWDDKGLLIDDPYGASVLAVSDGGSSRDWSDKNKRDADEADRAGQVGEDVAYPWAVVEGYKFNYMVTFA